eukprot:gene4579-7963_t
MKHKFNFLFYGPDSCGIEVISEYLCDHYGLSYITRNNLIQYAIESWPEDNIERKTLIRYLRNQQEDKITEKLMAEIFSTFYHDKHETKVNGFIFHNFPSTLEECKMMEMILTHYDEKLTNVFSFNISQENLEKRKSFICYSKPAPRFYYIGYNDPITGLFDDITGESLIENKSSFTVEDFEKKHEDILIRHVKIFIEVNGNLPLQQVLDNVDDEIELATKPTFYLAVLANHLLLNGMSSLLKEAYNVLKEAYPNGKVKSYSYVLDYLVSAVIVTVKESLQ